MVPALVLLSRVTTTQVSPDTIKKAYRHMAMAVHPDKCKEDGATEAFQKVSEATS